MILNKVWAIGRDTYLRLYPNPGVGFRISPNIRVAISIHRGFEISSRGKVDEPWRIKLRRLNRKLESKKWRS